MNIILKNYNDIKNNNVNKKNKMFGSDLNGYKNKIYICSDSEENIKSSSPILGSSGTLK